MVNQRTNHQSSKKSPSVSFGKRIAKLRKARGWSQPELARRCGWRKLSGQGRISHYEQSRRLPNPMELQKFAEVFGVPIGAFYGDSMEPADTVPVLLAREIFDKEYRSSMTAKPRFQYPEGLKVGPNAFVYRLGQFTAYVDPDRKAKVGDWVLASANGKTLEAYKIVNKNELTLILAMTKLPHQGAFTVKRRHAEIHGVIVARTEILI